MAEADPSRTVGSVPSGEGFDQILDRLRGVVERLEAGSIGLEESLAAFEEGVSLSRRGAAILDAAERRVEILTRSGDDVERIVPFSPGEGDAFGGGGGSGEGAR